MIKNVMVFVLVMAAADLGAQTTSVTDGTTPPPIEPGAPAGSYALSGFESVNLYNGHLNFAIPLLKVGGRGEAGYSISLPIERSWRIESHLNGTTRIYITDTRDSPGSPFWGTGFAIYNYTPGEIFSRSIVDGAIASYTCPSGTVGAGSSFYPSQTLTRLTFIESDGTEHELRDTALNGQPGTPLVVNDCTHVPNQSTNRGKVFVTNDGTSATFISDTDVFDQNTVAGMTQHQTQAMSGWLLFRNGVKYQFSSGRVAQILDRNGNTISLCYASGCADPGDDITITDSLGRKIRISYANFSTTFSDTITYPGYNGASRIISVNWTNLQFALAGGQSLQLPQTLFPNTNPSSTAVNPLVVQSITLPDGTAYSFQYNCYGEMKRAQLPTGGAFEYDYPYENNSPPSTPDCSGTSYPHGCIGTAFVNDPLGGHDEKTVFRRVMQRRVLPSGSGIEGRTVFTPSYPGNGTTSVQVEKQDATGNPLAREFHYFYGDGSVVQPYTLPDTGAYPGWNDGREYETDRVALETSLVAQKVQNTWGQRPCGIGENCWFGSPPNILHDPNVCQTNTSLLEVFQNQTSGQAMMYDSYNNRTDLYEYDFGSALAQSSTCPTSFAGYRRHTSNTFLTSGYDTPNTTNPSASIHVRNAPTSEIVYDQSNNINSKTEHSYDDYSIYSLQDDPGIVQQAAGYGTANTMRANNTLLRKWLNSSSSIDLHSTFDIAGNVVNAYDGRGTPTAITYNSPSYAFPNQVCKAGLCFSQAFDLNSGKLTSRTDFNNIGTSLAYNDALDRLTGATRASGQSIQNTTTFSYSASNTVVTAKSDLDAANLQKLITKKFLDGLGREIESRQYEDGNENSANYITFQRSYDAMGRPYQVSNPYRPTVESYFATTTLYDSLSRMKSVTGPDNSITSYTSQNNQVTVTDPAGKDRKTITDGLGRLAQVYENPSFLNLPTTYTYDAADNLVGVNQSGQTTCFLGGVWYSRCFTYDWQKRLTAATNPESGATSYSYDGNGNVLTKTDGRGVQTTMTYDTALNRVLTKMYPAGTPNVTYTYDDPAVPFSKGRLTKVDSSASTWRILGYDALGRPTSSSQTTGLTTYTFSNYSYNLADKLTSVTYPTARIVTTSYDLAGRPSGLSSGATNYATLTTNPSLQQFAYASQGAVKQMALGNGLTEQSCFNSRLQPVGIRLGSGATTNCGNVSDRLNLSYFYGTTNNNGNVQSQGIARPVGNWTDSYGYDGVNRLTSASESGTGSWSEGDGYDAFGNHWVTSSPGLPPLTNETPQGPGWYLTNNRISGWGYDGAGNITSIPSMSRTYGYDAESRMTSATVSGTTTYSYDGDGRRVQKVTSAGTTAYVYDAAGQLAAEYSTAATPGIGTEYLTADHLGSTRLVTDTGGNVTKCYDYLPFGAEIPSGYGGRSTCFGATIYPSSPDILSQKFTSKERDAETGWDFFGARYFSGAQGRWSSSDRMNVTDDGLLAPSGTLNKYVYGANNPLRFIDPDGRDVTALIEPPHGIMPGHFMLFANNPSTGQSAIMSFGPTDISTSGRALEVTGGPVGSTTNFELPKTADELRQGYAALSIQTTPEQAQDVINFINRFSTTDNPYRLFNTNCTTVCRDALKAIGILPRDYGRITPISLWTSLYQRFSNPAKQRFKTTSRYGELFQSLRIDAARGVDYGNPRYGINTFDFIMQLLKPPKACVTTSAVGGGTETTCE